MKIGNFFNTTIRNFFRNTEVRQSVCAIASACSGEITTENSDSVTFTGSGTADDPLTAEVTSGGSVEAESGLYSDGGIVRLGSNPLNPYDGLITTPTAIYAMDEPSGWFTTVQIIPGNMIFLQTSTDTNNSAVTISQSNIELRSPSATEGQNYLTIAGDSVNVTGNNTSFQGVVYIEDYSANYTDRSLVDKGYVDNHIPTTPNFIVTTNDEQDLFPGAYYTNNTTQNGIWNLPIVAGSEGKRIGLINQNSGTVTVNGDIYYNGAPVSTLEVMQGETYILYDNGLRWTVIA